MNLGNEMKLMIYFKIGSCWMHFSCMHLYIATKLSLESAKFKS